MIVVKIVGALINVAIIGWLVWHGLVSGDKEFIIIGLLLVIISNQNYASDKIREMQND